VLTRQPRDFAAFDQPRRHSNRFSRIAAIPNFIENVQSRPAGVERRGYAGVPFK